MHGRFWVETGMAVLSTVLLVLTAISREWIEVVFGVDPDHGDGSLEWLLFVVLALATAALYVTAGLEWRRSALGKA